MDETALNEAGQHCRAAVPLAPQPSLSRDPAAPHASCSVSEVLPPAAQLARRAGRRDGTAAPDPGSGHTARPVSWPL